MGRGEISPSQIRDPKRGEWREAIVKDDEDRKTFVRLLGEAAERAGFRVHGAEFVHGNGLDADYLPAGYGRESNVQTSGTNGRGKSSSREILPDTLTSTHYSG